MKNYFDLAAEWGKYGITVNSICPGYFYHMQINEGCIGDTIRNYADQFGHIHVADAPGRHEPGTGEINYAYVFRTLEENGYEGLIGYELFPKTTTAEAVKAIMAVG